MYLVKGYLGSGGFIFYVVGFIINFKYFIPNNPVRSGKTQLTIRICFSKGAARLDLSSVALKKHHIYSKFVAKGGAAGVVNQNVRADVRASPFISGLFREKMDLTPESGGFFGKRAANSILILKFLKRGKSKIPI